MTATRLFLIQRVFVFVFVPQDSEKYVEQLLALFNQFSRLVKEAFNDDPRFLTARDKAFKQVVNDTTVFKLELPCKQVNYPSVRN